LNQKGDKPMSNTIDTMIDPNDAVLLLIDHQSGLFQLVRDIELPALRSNVTALAKTSRLLQCPMVPMVP
jgi:nicotinamidase-related amidase